VEKTFKADLMRKMGEGLGQKQTDLIGDILGD
jgi:hypothetical protein